MIAVSREQEHGTRPIHAMRRGVATLFLAALAVTPALAQRPNIEVAPTRQGAEIRREPATYIIPNLVGHRLEEARRILESEGFKFREVSEDGTTNGERVVTQTAPAAGPFASRPEVTLYHRGETSSVVPSILGSDCNQARALLERARVALTRCEAGAVTRRYPPGKINRQELDTRVDARGNRAVIAWTEPQPSGGTAAASGTVEPPSGGANTSTHSELPRVPNLIASTCAAAAAQLQAFAARPNCVPGRPTGRFRPGQINEQRPGAGEPLPENRLVYVVTEPQSGVPDLRGQSCQAARGVLSQAGLKLGACVAGKTTGKVAPEYINSQVPAPGSLPPANGLVQVWTESAVTIPDLRGLNCDQAHSLLAQRKLVLTDCEPGKPDGTTPSGKIDAQEPGAGTSLPKDRHVRAWTAPPQVEVPDVEGQSAETARSRLEKVSLQAHFTGPSPRLGAEVRAQQPRAGSKVEVGTPVNLQMELAVPDLRGKTCAEAHKLAADYGFPDLACMAGDLANSTYHAGTVYAQEPAVDTVLVAPTKISVQLVAEAGSNLARVDPGAGQVQQPPSQDGSQVSKLPPVVPIGAPVQPPPGQDGPRAPSAGTGPANGPVPAARLPAGTPDVPPLDWQQRSTLLAVLLAGTALLLPVSRRAIFRHLGESAPTPPPPGLALRGEPDSLPRITVKLAGTPFSWPALSVRGEPGTPHYFVKLSDREDDHGS